MIDPIIIPMEDCEMITPALKCPFCPDDDVNPIQVDFFGGQCEIDGVACCETCYRVYCLTAENDAQQDERILEEIKKALPDRDEDERGLV